MDKTVQNANEVRTICIIVGSCRSKNIETEMTRTCQILYFARIEQFLNSDYSTRVFLNFETPAYQSDSAL